MLFQTQTTGGLDIKSEPQLEVVSQTTDAKNYVTDLLSELQTIARLEGLDALSTDIETILSRHLPRSGNI